MKYNLQFSLVVALAACTAVTWPGSVDGQVAGRFAAPILNVSPYARPVAMGEAYTALAYDLGVMRYNIGGLGGLQHPMLAAHFHDWIEDTRQGAIDGAIPTRIGVFGLSLAYFDEGEVLERDANFNLTGRTFQSNDLILSAGYGFAFNLFNNPLALGAGLKMVRQDLADADGTGLGLDVGMLYTVRPFSIGATVQNLTAKKLQLGDESSYLLPETMRAGAAISLPAGEQLSWNVGVDGFRFTGPDEDIRFAGGTELHVSEILAVRGGYKFYETETARWGGGFGIMIPMSWLGGSNTSFDYAYSPVDAFDTQSHRFSVSFTFGVLEQQVIAKRGEIESELEAARRARQEAEEARLAAMEAEGRVRDLEKLLAERLEKAKKIAETTEGEIEVEETAVGNVLMTLRVNFDFDKSFIRPDMFDTMAKVREILNTYIESQVWISGHCDSIGTDEYNFHLAQRRMNSVMDFLAQRGIGPGKFYNPVPYGEWRHLNDNSTPDQRFRNRRVEFLIYTGDNKPEIPIGSLIERVVVQDQSVTVEGNGRLEYTQTILTDPPRMLLKFPKVYVPDPLNIGVYRGNIQRARVGFHEEEGSTWVVLDMEDAVAPQVAESGRALNIVPGTLAQKP